MSLLIKALKKAEQTQQGNLSPAPKEPSAPESELSLTPIQPTESRSTAKIPEINAQTTQKQAAANLFLAKHQQQKYWFAILVSMSAALLIGGGVYLYFQLQEPLSITPPAQRFVMPATPQPAPMALPQNTANSQPAEPALPAAGPLLADLSEQQKIQSKTTIPEPAPRSENNIKITQESSSATLNPALANAYQTLREGRTDIALIQYQRLLNAEPNNIDALLGLASITAKQGKTETAAKYYVRVLELDPKNAAAQAGLIGFMGKTDPASSELRLKQLLQSQPAPYLFFALGNLYASQSQWTAAELAYFQAVQMEPGNPEYTFNLAVSLEHLNQTKQALAYYQLTLKLMQTNATPNIDKRVLVERISQLTSSTPHELTDTK